jgi:hypothetical protein
LTYAVQPERAKKYNYQENDFEYILDVPVKRDKYKLIQTLPIPRDWVPRSDSDNTEQDNSTTISSTEDSEHTTPHDNLQCKIRLKAIKLQYLINKERLNYTIYYLIKIKRGAAAVRMFIEPSKTVNLFTQLSSTLKENYLGGTMKFLDFRTISNYKIDTSKYIFITRTTKEGVRPVKYAKVGDDRGVLQDVTYHEYNGKVLWLIHKDHYDNTENKIDSVKNLAISIELVMLPKVGLVEYYRWPQTHEFCIRSIPFKWPVLPIAKYTGTKSLLNKPSNEDDPIQTFDGKNFDQRKDHSGIWYISDTNYISDVDTKLVRIRCLPRCSGIDCDFNRPKYVAKLPENSSVWNILGEFTLYVVTGEMEYSDLLDRLERFNSKVMSILPTVELLSGTDEVLLSLISKLSRADERIFRDKMAEIRKTWPEFMERFKYHVSVPSGSVNTMYYFLCMEMYNRFGRESEKFPNSIKRHIFDRYFNFLQLKRIDPNNVPGNGIYVWKWERVNRIGFRENVFGRKNHRSFEDEIESDVNSLETEYIYRYYPTQIPYRDVNIPSESTTWNYTLNKKKEYLENKDDMFCVIVVSPLGSRISDDKWIYVNGTSTTFTIDRTQEYPTLVKSQKSIPLPVQIWVIERQFLNYYEPKYFKMKELDNLRVYSI